MSFDFEWQMKMLEVLIVLAMVIVMHGIFVSFELKWLRDEIKYITHAIVMLDQDLFILFSPNNDDQR